MAKKRRKKKKLLKKLLYTFVVLCTAVLVFVCAFGVYIFLTSPEFNSDLLYKKESSHIYDSKGNLIATLGEEKRIHAEFKDLPEVLIDTTVATEDSRFFTHNGFDLPRFIIAGYQQLQGIETAGGASTVTMQLSKNSFTSLKSEGIDGIIRKFKDIYISIFKIEKSHSKEEILEFYLNAPYLGNGAYGVEQAAKSYFNKDVSDLSLVESVMIIGLLQAPGEYDPYINPEKADERKNQVIDLMVRHGYITEDIAKVTKEIKVEKIITPINKTVSPYIGFIDTVVQEVIDDTGYNPYEVSMDIHTTMIKSKQDVINNFYKTYKFKDKKVQVGIGVIDNDTGAIVAVGAGRNKKAQMTLNYATQINRHPGSTAKPIFDYGPGIEYLHWSSYTPFYDKPVPYAGGTMRNIDGGFRGFMTLQSALVQSRNTCALQAFRKLTNKQIYTFVTSLGIKPETTNGYINEAHAIGAFNGVSPVSLAAAYSAFGNTGYYVKPYSYTKIIYKENNEEYIPKRNRKKVMSDSTAYIMSYVLQKATKSSIRVSGTQIATKTGTSSYDDKLLSSLRITKNAIQDSWTVTYSPDYSIAIWYGYDKLSKKNYNTFSHASVERYKIQAKIVNKIMEKNSKFKRPSSVITRQVEVGSVPARLPGSYTPSSRIQSHLFIKGYQPKTTSTYRPPSTSKENNSGSTNTPNIPGIDIH